jgi:hypothetical protein
MSRQPDLFDKAADCERAMNMVSDPHEKIALKLLREMWISLANESVGFSECDLTKQIARNVAAHNCLKSAGDMARVSINQQKPSEPPEVLPNADPMFEVETVNVKMSDPSEAAL